MYQSLTNPEPSIWDEFVANHSRAHFLQTSAWGQVKADFGWQAQQVALADSAKKLVAGAQILYRELPFGLGKLAYVPFGPLVDWQNTVLVRDLLAKMDSVAKRKGAVFMKLEPGFEIDPALLKKHGCQLSPQTIQPPNTIVIPIRKRDDEGNVLPLEDIQKAMNQMTRRNIRKSEKNNITVREGTRADVDSFNRLLDRTAKRQGFGVHVPEYYLKVYNSIVASDGPPKGRLLVGSHTDETTGETIDLAASFIFCLGKWAWYVYGASSRDESQRMAPYAVQWAGIQWARNNGAHFYDLYGIPDASEAELEASFQERSEGMWSLYRTKRGWGGRVQRTVGTWDRVYNPLVYWIYRSYLFLRSGRNEET